MNPGKCAIVKQLPENLTHKEATRFFAELQPLLRTNRAQIVFDFSQVREIDSAGFGILLLCLEEVMKGNGDIKLAALMPVAAVTLELTGLDRLFEVFDNTPEAVQSFQSFPANLAGSAASAVDMPN